MSTKQDCSQCGGYGYVEDPDTGNPQGHACYRCGTSGVEVVEQPRLRILSVRRRVDSDDFDSGVTRVYRIKVRKDLSEAQIREAVADYFPAHRCQHSYDCCGNWYHTEGWLRRGGKPRHGKKRERIVTVSHYINI